MRWRKLGRIFEPKGQFPWMQKYGILPTPVYLKESNAIRVFFATSALDNIGRITYLEVSADDPTLILTPPVEIVLNEGEPGLFDDCGVNPSSFVDHGGNSFLYYVGYQRSFQRPFTLFPGVARLENRSFVRVQRVPVIDRSSEYPYSLAAPFVMYHESKFKMWLWIAKEWTKVNGKDYLSAKIGYAESDNGIDWQIIESSCIEPAENEFSLGRPWVVMVEGVYCMYYSVRYVDKLYRIGYAESTDGQKWIRKDSEVGIDVSNDGWDSEMICYPAVVEANGKSYMFYNGNNNGATGFGVAVAKQRSL